MLVFPFCKMWIKIVFVSKGSLEDLNEIIHVIQLGQYLAYSKFKKQLLLNERMNIWANKESLKQRTIYSKRFNTFYVLNIIENVCILSQFINNISP